MIVNNFLLIADQVGCQVLGILRTLCEVTKLGSAEQVQAHKEMLSHVAQTVEGNDTMMSNTFVRKLRTKLIARVVVRLLPGKARRLRTKGAFDQFVLWVAPQ